MRQAPSGGRFRQFTMEGSELDYLGAGVILFKVLNLDIASTTQSTKISGTDLARGLTVNLGIEISL